MSETETDDVEMPAEPGPSDLSALDLADEEMKKGDTYKIGFFKVLELVVTVGDGHLDCKLKGLGKTLDEFTLSKSNTHVKIGGTLGVATYHLTFRANFEDRTLHLGGQACYWDFEWHCSSFDKTILHF